MERKQFTFYYSFYDVIQCIKSKEQRVEAYDAICAYALLGQLPDMDRLGMGAKMVMKICIPILSAANKKSAAGKKNERCCEDDEKILERYDEDTDNKIKNKIKNKNKDKDKDNSLTGARERFEIFWNEFPKKTDKQRAWVVFQSVDVEMDVLLQGLRRQKMSEQWLEQGGRFVPRAADWLRDRRWEDQLPRGNKVPMGGTHQLGEAELAAVRKMLEE